MSRSALPLRAHHLMCVTTYQGKGYSPEFVARMNQVWHAIRARQVERVRLLIEADPICGGCPHLTDPAQPTSCRFHGSIVERDARLLAAMGWEDGAVVELEAALEEVHARHGELLGAVCTGCDWLSICREGRLTLREAEAPIPPPAVLNISFEI